MSLLKHILQSLQLRDCINFLLTDCYRGFLLVTCGMGMGTKMDILVLKYEAHIFHFMLKPYYSTSIVVQIN